MGGARSWIGDVSPGGERGGLGYAPPLLFDVPIHLLPRLLPIVPLRQETAGALQHAPSGAQPNIHPVRPVFLGAYFLRSSVHPDLSFLARARCQLALAR